MSKKCITAGVKIGIAALFLLIIGIGCGSNPPASRIDELDLAIRDASDYLNQTIPEGRKIAFINIQSDSQALSEYIIDELIANAVNDRFFPVVDRQQLDKIRAEQNFQLSGEVDDTSAMKIGKLLGAQIIVSGGVSRLGKGYRIKIRALEVQTAQVQGQYNRNIASSQLISDVMEGGGSGSYGGYGTPATGTTTASGGLTISGLSAYRNRYIIAISSDPSLVASEGVIKGGITAGKINSDSITLNVRHTEGRTIYNGSDKKLIFRIYIVNKAQVTSANLSSSTVKRETVEVDFTNGIGSVNLKGSSTQSASGTKTGSNSSSGTSTRRVPLRWSAGEYLDQFKDPTGTFYIEYDGYAVGVFSNTWDSNVSLQIKPFRYSRKYGLSFYNGRFDVVMQQRGNVYIKTDDGDEKRYTAVEDGGYVKVDYSPALEAALKKATKIRFTTSTMEVIVEMPPRFEEALALLEGSK